MKARKLFSKVLCGILAAVMLLGMMPVFASADEPTIVAEGDSGLENLVLDKTAVLQDDGTYTINLSAYAKGNVTKETLKQVKPTDVILILDQSGSMEQQNIQGIPTGYVATTATNADLANAGNYYYYKVGENYYRVSAKLETIAKEVTWVGDDGKTYTDADLSTTWTARTDEVFTTATPYVTSSLDTYTRETTSTEIFLVGTVNYPSFINDKNDSDKIGGIAIVNMSGLRNEFFRVKGSSPRTAVIYNNIPEDAESGWQAQDKYYVAASYIAVTRQEVTTCRYVYTYVDGNGKTVTIGNSDTGIQSALEGTTAALAGQTDPLAVYTRGTAEGTRMKALQYAAKKFIDDIYISAVQNSVDHRVAIVGFASDAHEGTTSQYYYSNTELFVGATQYNYAVSGKQSTYNTNGNLAGDHYGEAFQNAGTVNGYNALYASIDALAGYGGTHPDLGFEMANGIFGANDATGRNRVVIFLTDGQPGDSGFDPVVAKSTIEKVKTTKETYGAKIFTVAVLNDSEFTEEINTFLNDTSSDGTFTKATSTEALEGFFESVDEVISGTTTSVTLTENSYVIDRLSDYFVVPEGFSVANNVTVQRAKHVGYEAFGAPEAIPADEDVVASLSYAADGTTVRGVSVKGFNFISSDGTTWGTGNLVRDNSSDAGADSTSAAGYKLLITITGLLAKDEAALGTYINTNSNASGVWDVDGEGHYGIVKEFPMPTTLLDKKMFVLDYAKGAELDVYGATKIDSAEDKLFSKVTDSSTSLTGAYGDTSIANGSMTYAPKTTKWNGYDSFYALGKDNTKGDEKTKNIWSKVTVMPANNVYYEDTFIESYENEKGETVTGTATVGITYKGNWDVVESGTNAEDANGRIQGWVEDLADDKADSDGTIHMSSTKAATATFSFTGTGFDVYSRTNMTSGKVYAKISQIGYREADTDVNGDGEIQENEKKDARYNVRNTGMIVDTESASGEYYAIPTLWFDATTEQNEKKGFTYGEYDVTIKVQNDAEDGTDYSYCIDGIRIYNPLGDGSNENQAVSDDVVQEAYGDEINAAFMSVRDLLIEAGTFNQAEDTSVNGMVFIDKVTAEQTTDKNEAGNEVKVTEPATEALKVETNKLATYVDYGPKNEVYLAPGQGIVFTAGSPNTTVHIGLKAPEGTATANVTYYNGTAQGQISVGHTTDLYYPVTTDANGYVVIKNAGNTLLSVTKLKVIPTDSVDGFTLAPITVDNAVTVANAFDAMPVMAYSMRPTTPEEPTEPEVPSETPSEPEVPSETPSEPENPTEAPTEPEVPTEPETPTEPENKPNIDIQNPTEPEEEKPNGPTPEQVEALKVFMNKMFNAFRGWLKR